MNSRMMNIKLILLSFSLAVMLTLVGGCKDERLGEPLKIKVLVMSKDSWISKMEQKLPTELCEEGMYFRECFDLSKQQCLSNAETTTKRCLSKLGSQIPERLELHKDGVHWGQEIFNCAGHAFEVRQETKLRLTAPKCKTAAKKLKIQG